MENPYDASSVVVIRDPVPQPTRPTSLCILSGLLLLTFLFALKNSLEEGFPFYTKEMAMVVGLAGLSQLPGILIALWRWKKEPRATMPLLLVAYFVAFTGWLAYFNFAFNGQADSINSAAHMHVFAFPILHCVIAVVLYAIAAVIAVGVLVATKEQSPVD